MGQFQTSLLMPWLRLCYLVSSGLISTANAVMHACSYQPPCRFEHVYCPMVPSRFQEHFRFYLHHPCEFMSAYVAVLAAQIIVCSPCWSSHPCSFEWSLLWSPGLNWFAWRSYNTHTLSRGPSCAEFPYSNPQLRVPRDSQTTASGLEGCRLWRRVCPQHCRGFKSAVHSVTGAGTRLSELSFANRSVTFFLPFFITTTFIIHAPTEWLDERATSGLNFYIALEVNLCAYLSLSAKAKEGGQPQEEAKTKD